MSLENRHTNKEFQSLQKSYENWEAGEPSADLWENLEAELAVSAVWHRLDETLELNGSSADQSLADAYENWSPNTSGDGWSKLEEELSRERVWQRLNTTLNYPVTTRIPWLKMAAASLVFVFTAFYTDYFTGSNSEPPMTGIQTSQGEKLRDLAANGTTSDVNDEQTNPSPIKAPAQNKQLAVITGNPVNQVADNNPAGQPDRVVAQTNPTKVNAENREPGTTVLNPANETTGNGAQDLADLDQLSRKAIEYAGTNGTIEAFHFLPFKAPFKPRFSVLLGGQFAFINENDRSAFSSSIPSMGIAADMQYNAYSGKVRFTQDLGFSQYAQSNGSYVNGRYVNSNQKLNTVHLMSTIGYTFRGVTVSGGITVNRLLNGYEESRTAITNVYNSKKLQVGATAGIDYHFTPFKNKTALGVGVQYQFMSKLKSENTVFNDIQGVKLQIKYSF